MARFTNFNQILSQGANNEEDDDDEEEGTQDSGDKDDGFDEDDDDKKDSDTSSSVSFGNNPDKGSKVEKVNITEPVEKLEEEYVDNNYWKLGSDNAAEVDVDALLAELED